MPTKRPDKFVHLRLTPETQQALAVVESFVQADPLTAAALRVHGSDRVPHTRMIHFAIGLAATYLAQREAA